MTEATGSPIPGPARGVGEAKRTVAMLLGKVRHGGGERVLARLAHDLADNGHRILIYSYYPDWGEEVASLGPEARFVLLRQWPSMANKVRATREIVSRLRQDRPDVLLTFVLNWAETAVPAARMAGVPTVVSERCDPRVSPTRTTRRILRRLTFRLATAVVFQTPEVRDWFGGRVARKGAVIPNPILDRDLPEPLPAGEREREIVMAGRMDHTKNYGSALRAFAAMRAKDWRLTIYGDGPDRRELESMASELGVADRVRFAGNVERVVDHIGKAAIYLLSSRSEGMPNALIEGMAMGLACISTDFASGGARALITPGRDGLLVEVSPKELPLRTPDPALEARLTEALDRLAGDSPLRERMQKEAPAIRQRLEAGKVIAQWQRLINTISTKGER